MRRGSNVKNQLSNETRSCGDHCARLDTDRRRRRKGAEEDDSVRLQGKRCPCGPTQTEELEIHLCWAATRSRISKREEGNEDTKGWDTVWLVMAFTCANETCIAMPRLNRCQIMSTTKSSMTSRPLSATARSGGKRHRNAATPRGEKITRHGCVWRTVPSAVN